MTHACTKRYVSCLKRLAGKESRKRKLAAQGAEAQPLIEAELAASELRRWPDYAFLMMGSEKGGLPLPSADEPGDSCPQVLHCF